MYKSPDIVTDIKVRRLEWLGYVVRMEDTRLLKMVLNAKLEGRRTVGRPRLRWLDDEADIKALGVKRWRIKAQDRKEWSAIIREAKVELKGPEKKKNISVDLIGIGSFGLRTWSDCLHLVVLRRRRRRRRRRD
jgi:hypothetical protein